MVSILWDAVVQLTIELLGELGWEAVKGSLESRRRTHPALAAVGIVLLGTLAGGLVFLIRPERIIPSRSLPGASLIFAPLVTGAAMEYYGRWRVSRGGSPSRLATFWGGALFALAMAVTRFLLLRVAT